MDVLKLRREQTEQKRHSQIMCGTCPSTLLKLLLASLARLAAAAAAAGPLMAASGLPVETPEPVALLRNCCCCCCWCWWL